MPIHQIRKFKRFDQDALADGADIIEAVQNSVFMEAALLVSCASLNTDVCALAIDCIPYICAVGRTMDDLEAYTHRELLMIENITVYEAIAKSKESFLGRKAHQKRILECLRGMAQHTPGILGAWEEIWERWKILSQIDLDGYEGLMSNSDQGSSRLSRGADRRINSPQFAHSAGYGKPYQNMNLEERALQWQVCKLQSNISHLIFFKTDFTFARIIPGF
jgi:hypothetical protein